MFESLGEAKQDILTSVLHLELIFLMYFQIALGLILALDAKSFSKAFFCLAMDFTLFLAIFHFNRFSGVLLSIRLVQRWCFDSTTLVS